MLSRDQIVNALVNRLTPLEYVHAFWEGGAIAYGRNDKFSDIDAYLLVIDGNVAETFEAVEKTLETLSPISQKYLVRQNPWPGSPKRSIDWNVPASISSLTLQY